MLQELVMDVLAVGGEDGASADEAPDDGECSLQDGQSKRNHRMATATMVGAFWAPASVMALSKNPMKRLPESPRKMVAGLKLKRRNPTIAPASAMVITVTIDG